MADAAIVAAATSTGYGHGKLIVLGEHAVVYGYPALAAALSSGVTLTASQCDGASADGASAIGHTEIAEWQLLVHANTEHPVAIARRQLCASLGIAPWLERSLIMRGEAKVPAGAGLGSSAAMAVAMARAISIHCGISASGEQICAAANAAERTFHDTPSGVDVALAYYGGVGEFRRGTGLVALQLPALRVAVGVTGEQRNTKTMVQTVATATSSRADDARLVELGQLASDGREAWLQRNWQHLGYCCNRAQMLLADLGVSTARIELLCQTARTAGASGVKLTGAGGGGSVLAIGDDVDGIVSAWQAIGMHAFVASIGGTVNATAQEQL